jgi:hypothetical protein
VANVFAELMLESAFVHPPARWLTVLLVDRLTNERLAGLEGLREERRGGKAVSSSAGLSWRTRRLSDTPFLKSEEDHEMDRSDDNDDGDDEEKDRYREEEARGGADDDDAVDRRRRARNRWFLFYTLIKNPQLRAMRRPRALDNAPAALQHEW